MLFAKYWAVSLRHCFYVNVAAQSGVKRFASRWGCERERLTLCINNTNFPLINMQQLKHIIFQNLLNKPRIYIYIYREIGWSLCYKWCDPSDKVMSTKTDEIGWDLFDVADTPFINFSSSLAFEPFSSSSGVYWIPWLYNTDVCGVNIYIYIYIYIYIT